MADIFRAGQFELQTAKIISASGQEVDVTLSTISVTIFEDISKFAISGGILVDFRLTQQVSQFFMPLLQ